MTEAEMVAAEEAANTLQKVPSTPTSSTKWLFPPLSPGRSVSLSPSRMRKTPPGGSMDRHASVSPRRPRREMSASPAPRGIGDRRQKLKEYSSLDDAVELLKESNDIVVLSGAGISTTVGIPDFRSKQGRWSDSCRIFRLIATGLYNLVQDARFSDPQQLFYRDMFEQYPKEFWRDVRPIVPKLRQGALLNEDGSNAKSLINAVPKYSAVHSFLELLQAKKKLLTNFTQNIDALEMDAGVDLNNVVACHGTWETATCLTCGGKVGAKDYLPIVLAGKLPLCSCGKPIPVDPDARQSTRLKKAPKVEETDIEYVDTVGGESPGTSRPGRHKRRRIESELDSILARDSDDDDKFDAPSRPGLLKPDITFFGESVAANYYPTLNSIKEDIDLLIIVGTSLAAEPVSQLPLSIPGDVPQIWISNERCTNKVKGLQVDIELIGDADTIIRELCARVGWTNALINRVWRNQLGSTRQAKDAVARAKQGKPQQITAAQVVLSKAEQRTKEPAEIAEEKPKQNTSDVGAGTAEVPKAGQQPEDGTTNDSTRSGPTEPLPPATSASTTTSAPSTANTSPQSIKDNSTQQPPPIPIAAAAAPPPPPTFKIEVEQPPLSPPIPIRTTTSTTTKRPLSTTELPTAANDAAFRTNTKATDPAARQDHGPIPKKLRAESPAGGSSSGSRPQQQQQQQQGRANMAAGGGGGKTAASAGAGKGTADAGVRIFRDEAFDWVTYFKKMKS